MKKQKINHPSDSIEAMALEKILIGKLSGKIKAKPSLASTQLTLPLGTSVQVDGYSSKAKVLCEAWAHIGAPKPAQKSKVMKDALKLIFIEKSFGKKFKKIIVFADEKARSSFIGNNWMAECLKYFDINCELIKVSAKKKRLIKNAQKRQRR